MCGIVTVLGADARARASAIMARLSHRGPDGQGLEVAADDRLALGHTRLAIVDVAGGAQPLTSEDGAIVAVVNGQLYEERGLRRDLEARGHRFATGSDCEVLVHLYEEHGLDCLAHIDGMFAFALWDRRLGRVLLARDRLGEKPLAYARVPGGVLIASEVSTLLADPSVRAQLDPQAVAAYLANGYVPAPHSILSGVRKLRPGCHAWLDLASGELAEPVPYWQPPQEPDPQLAGLSVRAAAERIEPLLAESVALRLRADVPLGIFLSGGLDSSLLATYAARAGAAPPCFVLGFSGESGGWDERPRAREVARHLGLPLHEVVADRGVLAELPRLLAEMDEPYADSSALLFDRLVTAARARVKVVLAGDGGDELFGGYPRHLAVRLDALYGQLPRGLRRLAAASAPLLGSSAGGKSARLGHLQRFLAAGALPANERLVRWQTLFSAEQRARIAPGIPPTDAPELEALGLLAAGAARDAVARALRFDLVRYLPDDLLVKSDRVGLQHGLEVRAPFLARRLVEAATALPGRVRLPGAQTKPILRHLARRHLPPSVARARKGGFSLPLGRWLREGQAPQLQNLLQGERLTVACPFLDPREVAALLAAHQSGRADHTHRLYALAALVAWSEGHPETRT